MNESFLDGDRIEILPGLSDLLTAKQGVVKGISNTPTPIGSMYIIAFTYLLSEDYPWSSCIVPASFLKRLPKE